MVIMTISEAPAMSPRTLSVAQAKAALSDAIRDVESGSAVVITRHGKAVAALVRAADLATLERHRAAGPEGGLASLAGGWKGSAELVEAIASSPRRPTRRGLPRD
jgi:prevent-host-death family protein